MSEKKLRAIVLFGILLLIGAVITVLRDPGANQYEISVYSAYPGYFWAFVIGSILIGSLVVIASARSPNDKSWMFGLTLVLLTNMLLLSIPYIRGYQMIGRADAMSHVGFSQDVVLLGSINSNIYPPMHVVIAALGDATGVQLVTLGLAVPLVFSGLYFAGMFYLLVFLFDSRERILFSLPFVMLPILGRVHVGLRPFDLSIMLIPLVLYLFFRSQNVPTPAVRGAFVVVLLGILLYHPLTALLIIGVFVIYFAGRYAPGIKKEYAAPTSFVSVSIAVFAAWYSNFTGIILRFVRVFERLFGGGEEGAAPVEGYTSAAEQASPPLIDLLRVLTFSYGVEIILFGLGFLFIGAVLWLLVREKLPLEVHTLMFVGTLVVFTAGSVIFLFLDLIVPHDRPLQIAKISAVVLAGQLFYLLWIHLDWSQYQPKTRTALHVSIVLLVTVLVALTILSIYPSPLSASSNSQVTEMEMDGNEWLTQHGDASDEVTEFGISYRRFYHAQHGVQPGVPFLHYPVPNHFNYTNHDNLGQSYGNDTYMTLTTRGRIVYPEVFPNYPENWRFTPEEFDRLEQDHSTERIYDNGDYNQYLIEGMADEEVEQ